MLDAVSPSYELIYNASNPERFAGASRVYSIKVVMLKDESQEKYFHGSTFTVNPNAKTKRTGDLLCGDFLVESVSGNTVTFRPSGDISYIVKTPH
jgi:indole-3-glycerol phosphate synthase